MKTEWFELIDDAVDEDEDDEDEKERGRTFVARVPRRTRGIEEEEMERDEMDDVACDVVDDERGIVGFNDGEIVSVASVLSVSSLLLL